MKAGFKRVEGEKRKKTRLLQSPTDLDYSTRKRGEDYFR